MGLQKSQTQLSDYTFFFDTSVWVSQMVLLVKNPPVNAGFLPRESYGQRRLASYSLCMCACVCVCK